MDFKYDVYGNRIEKSYDDDGAGPHSATVTRFAYDAWKNTNQHLIGNENWDVWADLNGSSSLTTRYIRGDVIDQVFARCDMGAKYWYLTDRLGSIRDVLNSGGTIKDTIAYDGFGGITSETDSSFRGRYAWTGREIDTEINLQYNRARYYDAGTGRWISQDPRGFDAGDSNLFRYVHNTPLQGTDPSGQIVIIIHGIRDDGTGWVPEVYNGMVQAWNGAGNGKQIGIKFVWSAPGWLPLFGPTKPGLFDAKNSVADTLNIPSGNEAIMRLIALLRGLNATNCPLNIVAHSQGTMITMGAVAMAGVNVKNVVLLNSPHHITQNLGDIGAARAFITGNFRHYYSQLDEAVIWVNRRPKVPFVKGVKVAAILLKLFGIVVNPVKNLFNKPIQNVWPWLTQVELTATAPLHSNSHTFGLGASDYGPAVASNFNEFGLFLGLQGQVQQIINQTIPPGGLVSASMI